MGALAYGYYRTKLDLKKGRFGVRVDEEGIKFFEKGKQWKYDEIEFVFIDENYNPFHGFIVIKSTNTPLLKISEDLLKNPKKF